MIYVAGLRRGTPGVPGAVTRSGGLSGRGPLTARSYDPLVDIPDDLIALERAAEEERARLSGLAGEAREEQWRAWRDASERVQAAITEHAAAAGVPRVDVEMAVKRAVRHAEGDSAE